MKTIILTLVIAFVIMAGSFMIYISSGAYDISQLTPHNAMTKWIIKKTTHSSIVKKMKDIEVPAMGDSASVVIGFEHYHEMCVSCHGAPGVKPWDMAEGLYPKPPVLYKSNHLPQPAEAFWIIKNGIKMTSMPAYGPTHDDKRIWAITDFLLNKMNKMSPEEYHTWEQKYAEDEDEDAENRKIE